MKKHLAVLLILTGILAGGCRDLRDNELHGYGTVKIYDPVTGVVSRGAPPPLAADLEHELSVVHDEIIYHFGSPGYAQAPRPIMRYNPGANSWSLRPRPRLAMERFATAPEGLYLLSSISELFLYRPDTNIAEPLGQIPQIPQFGMYPVDCTYDNGTFYVVAVTAGPGIIVDSFNRGTRKWESHSKQSLPGHRVFPKVEAVNAEGGWYFLVFEHSLSDVRMHTNVLLYRYDFSTDVFEERAPFSDKFERFTYATSHGSNLYFFFQDDPKIAGGAAALKAYSYDTAADTWGNGATFSLPGGCLGCVTGDNAAYLLGGYDAYHLALVEYDFASETASMAVEDLGRNFTKVFAHYDGFKLAWADGKVIILGMGFYEEKR